MEIIILTAFPKIFDSYLTESLFKRAQLNKLIRFKILDLRKFATGKHKKIDDRPFGGGPGMVLMVEPIYKALKSLSAKHVAYSAKNKTRTILFSTRGKKLDETLAKKLSKYKRLVLICGRYEGVDERVAENLADEEVSIGDYVLSGGELPALVLSEAVARFLPGFLGKYESLEGIKGSYKTYTRPVEFKLGRKKLKVPKVLLSGNHKDIEEWRRGII
ncbi:MAG: tRNA (guanosine(37)-N1)-methyltransferase TrmD [Candidatus Liptonbacteria bacterium]|nr:tRNA (guanosine(37)-N1)-methyltransferase TrmD [Candidatus Liptonbacteria bacterium]